MSRRCKALQLRAIASSERSVSFLQDEIFSAFKVECCAVMVEKTESVMLPLSFSVKYCKFWQLCNIFTMLSPHKEPDPHSTRAALTATKDSSSAFSPTSFSTTKILEKNIFLLRIHCKERGSNRNVCSSCSFLVTACLKYSSKSLRKHLFATAQSSCDKHKGERKLKIGP